MYLNRFAPTAAPLDMTGSDEFASLLQSAADLGIPHSRDVRYVSRQLVVRGLRFHFTEWGDPAAPPALLLHGGNQSSHSWDMVSLHLADRYRVLALDQRGHGDSEWSRDCDYSIQARVDDVFAFLDEVGVERPIVLGHSMGGMVTLNAALARPHVARALVIVDVGPELSPEGTQVIGEFVRRNVEFDDLDVYLDNVARYDRFRSREHIARTVKYNLLQRFDGKYVSKVDHRRAPIEIEPTPLEHLERITCPTLVVRGGESAVLLADAAERFVAALPDGHLVTVPDVGHNVHGGNTPGFLEAVAPFLASLVSSEA